MNFNTFLSIFLVCSFLILSTHSQTWGTWSDWTTCTDTCGRCGTQLRTRTCSSTTGSCTGDSSAEQVCAPAICKYPRSSCCNGSPASVDGMFECA